MLVGTAIVLVLLIALLAIPVSLTFQLSWQQLSSGEITVRWAFGLVHARLAWPRPHPAPPSGRARAERPPRRTRHAPGHANVWAALRQRPFRQRLFRFVRALWQAFHKHDLTLRMRIGLGDPADTGQLWAVVGPVAGVLYTLRDASVEIEPDFNDRTLELESSGTIRFIPLQLIGLTLGLLLSPPIWRGVAQMRRAATP